MNASKTKLSNLLVRSIEVDEIHKCFFEADKLDAEAYKILNDYPLTPSSIQRFSAAKRVADAKYAEAHMRWDFFKNNRRRSS
jgi:hypothetical protein